MKHQIHVTQQNNRDYFDNKLSQKGNIIIKRIIRNIENNSGVVTRRGNTPLEVMKQDNRWTIKSECSSTEQKSQPATKKQQENKWDTLTRHEQILLTVVKFDLHENWGQCEQEAQKALNESSGELFTGIPRFIINEIYILNEKKYKIIKNNGKTVIYYGSGGEQKRTLEADSLGEFIRPDKKILHSINLIKKKE